MINLFILKIREYMEWFSKHETNVACIKFPFTIYLILKSMTLYLLVFASTNINHGYTIICCITARKPNRYAKIF